MSRFIDKFELMIDKLPEGIPAIFNVITGLVRDLSKSSTPEPTTMITFPGIPSSAEVVDSGRLSINSKQTCNLHVYKNSVQLTPKLIKLSSATRISIISFSKYLRSTRPISHSTLSQATNEPKGIHVYH
jgi:hypothetical protein